MKRMCHLNTSHVKVQRTYTNMLVETISDLNTSHVKVQQKLKKESDTTTCI